MTEIKKLITGSSWIGDLPEDKIKKFHSIFEMFAGGGWIPTRLLSDRLYVLKISSIGNTYEDIERIRLETNSLPTAASNRTYLLIECRIDYGKSKSKEIELLNINE